MAPERGTGAHQARRRTPLIVVASLLIHAAVLGPLALNSLGIDVARPWDDPPETLSIVNVELVRGSRLQGGPAGEGAISGPEIPLMQRPVAATAPSNDNAMVRAAPVPLPTTEPTTRPTAPRMRSPAATDAPIDGVSAAWQAGANRLASGPGRVGPDCRRAELLPAIEREICARRFAVADATTATARLGPRRLTRAESVREDGFAEQAAANEAWSRYRRSEDEGSYPGLRSMLKHF